MVRRFLPRLAAAAGLALVATGALASPAAAHASLEGSEPASQARLAEPPRQIELAFDEPVEAGLGGIRLFDSGERELDVGDETQPPGDDTRIRAPIEEELGDGVYAVTWRATSADGHPVSGAFTFQVGEAAPADAGGLVERILAAEGSRTDVGGALAVARFVGYAGLALFLGGLAFAATWSPTLPGRVTWLLWAGWGLLLGGGAATFALQGPNATGRSFGAAFDAGLWQEIAGTRLGHAVLLRLAIGAASVLLLLRLRRCREPWWQGVAVGVAGTLAFSVAYAGHAGTGRWPGAGLLLGMAHVLAMAVWVGGLVFLAAATLRREPGEASTRSVGAAVATARAPSGAPDAVAESVGRFSSLALGCVVVVVVSGVLQAWRVLEDGLFAGDYGRLLVIKTSLVAAMLVVAGLARRLVRRHWPAPGQLRQIVVTELALGVAVLGVTALLVGTSPSEAASSKPFSTTLVQSDTIVSITVDPARRGGGNALHVYVSLPGSALQAVAGVEARLALPSRDLGPIPVPLAPEGVNHFSAYDVQFPFAGEWELDLRVQPTPAETIRFTTPVPIGS